MPFLSTDPRTPSRSLDRHHNSFNFLRLVFAAAVIVHHTWPIGGYGSGPGIGHYSLGRIAVAGFFAISGYLIASSRMHHSGSSFIVRRVLRIYPGYIMCLLATAVVFAPIATLIGTGHLDLSAAAHYVRSNLLLKINTYDIPHTLDAVPYARVWNGSLWTLRYEFFCYLVAGVVVSFVRYRLMLMSIVFAGAFVTSAVTSLRDMTGVVSDVSDLLCVFAAGSLLALASSRLKLSGALAAAALAALVVSVPLELMFSLGALPLCYLVLWLAKVLPFARIARRNDISYGMYIYGMPVQQLLVLLHFDRLPALAFAALAIVATVPFAAASWFVVERPAQRAAPRIDARLDRRRRLNAGAGVILLVGCIVSLYPAYSVVRDVLHRLI